MSEFSVHVDEDILSVARPGSWWLSTGWRGGFERADAAFNVTVPAEFERTDLDAYVGQRLADADLPSAGPAATVSSVADGTPPVLLTGVSQHHARAARSGPVVAVATVGLSNPAALPMDPTGRPDPAVSDATRVATHPGTVNVIVSTDRPLDAGGLASLLTTAVEARTVTVYRLAGFPGTTTDAVVVGCARVGQTSSFAGPGTTVGAPARASVRAAVRASYCARYADEDPPTTVDDAAYGVSTDRIAQPFEIQ